MDRWRRWAGVRVRTALIAALSVGLAIAVASIGFLGLLERNLKADADRGLREQAQTLVAGLHGAAADRIELQARLGNTNVIQVVGEDGAVLSASPELGKHEALTLATPAVGQSIYSTRPLSLDPDADYRQLALGAQDVTGRRVTVVVAQSLEVTEKTSRIAITLVVIGAPIGLVVVALTTYWLAGLALRPVESMRRQVADIDARSLDVRVPLPNAHDEVWRLGGTMNLMLERLESAASAQRQFVSDASHELRSPLAALRTSVEVALAHPEGNDWQSTGEVVLEESGRVERLVADLLLLARADERGLQLRRDDVDLDDVLTAEVQRLKTTTALKVTSRIEPVRVHGDRDRLARVVRNLVDNAVRHTSTSVHLSVVADQGFAIIEIGDDGPGVPLESRERAFERFVRLDDGRSRAEGGTGLGLAIVRQLVQAHGGDVAFVEASVVRVRVPQSPHSDGTAR